MAGDKVSSDAHHIDLMVSLLELVNSVLVDVVRSNDRNKFKMFLLVLLSNFSELCFAVLRKFTEVSRIESDTLGLIAKVSESKSYTDEVEAARVLSGIGVH